MKNKSTSLTELHPSKNLSKFSLTEDLFETLDAIFAAPDDSKLSYLFKQAGLDPKQDLMGFPLFEGGSFKDEGFYYERANLRNTNLRETQWNDNVSLYGTLLEGADLTGALGLTEEKLSEAYIDDNTILPEALDRQKIYDLHAALEMPGAPPLKPDNGSSQISCDPS